MPETVSATLSDRAAGLPVEDTAVAVFRFGDGLVAELASSFLFAAADVSVELYGTRGTALVAGVDLASRDITEAPCLRVYTDGQPARRWTPSPIVPRFKLGQFHHQNALQFIESLHQGTPPPIPIVDGYRALAMIMAAYASAKSGRVEPIDRGP
jgi:predicted dehydrogenase